MNRLIIVAIVFAILGGFGFQQFNSNWPQSEVDNLRNWGERLIRTKTVGGRNCSVSTDTEISKAADFSELFHGFEVSGERRNLFFEHRIPDDCLENASISLLEIRPHIGLVSSVWRCESDGLTGEFRLSTYRDSPAYVEDGAYCEFALFEKQLHLRIGDATGTP